MSCWTPIGCFRGKTSQYDEEKQVDLWLQVPDDPFGEGFRVANCWRQGDRWLHVHQGQAAPLVSEYITHYAWVPKPPRRERRRRHGP